MKLDRVSRRVENLWKVLRGYNMYLIVDNILFMLFLTSITGGLVTGLWMLYRKFLEKRTDVRDMYRLLRAVALTYIFPLFYLVGDNILQIRQDQLSIVFLFTSSLKEDICSALFLVWAIGVIILLLIRFPMWSYFHRIIRECIRADVKSERILKQVCQELKIRKKVRLYRGYSVASPFVKGVIHPAIYLPMDDLRDARELEMVFVHELSHWKQKDILWKPVFAFINIIFWFNPLSGYLWRQLTLWAEVCCDANCYEGNFGQKEYFELLCKMQDSALDRMMGFMPMWSEGKNQLLWRLNHMNTGKVHKINRIAVAMIAVSCMLFGSTLTCAAAGGMRRAYEKTYWNVTENEEMERQDVPQERTIEYGTLEEMEAETQIVRPDEESGIMLYGVGLINWTVAKGTTDMTSGFTVNKGDPIKVMLSINKSSSKIRVGIMEMDGTTQYISGGGEVHQTFYARKSGVHCVFIYNHSGEKIKAEGSYTY